MSSPLPAETSPTSADRQLGTRGSVVLFLVAGLLAGGASLGVLMLFHNWHKVPAELADFDPLNDAAQARLLEAQAEVDAKNLVVTVAIVGAVVAGILGLAGGIRDRSPGRVAVGLLLGLVLGGGLGLASTYLGPKLVGPGLDASIPRTADFQTAQNWKMFSTLAVHATMWGLIGLAAALAATIPTRRTGLILSSVVGALVAATVAMMIYQLLLASVFQSSRFDLYMPRESGPMIAWTLPVGILIGIALGRLSVSRPTKAA